MPSFPSPGFNIVVTERFVWNDPVNAAHRIALVKVDLLANLLGYRFRRLDHVPVDIHDVQIPVGSVGEVARPKPYVGGREELNFVLGAMRGECGTVGSEHIAVNQIAADITRKDISAVFLRENIAEVNSAAGRRSKPAAELLGATQVVLVITLLPQLGSFLPPLLWPRKRKHRGRRASMIGDILRRRPYIQQRSELARRIPSEARRGEYEWCSV